jgi:exodeoxyribonuclease VII small subunit
MAPKKLTYKEAKIELEAIIDGLESPDMDIDILAEKVKRATQLIRSCKEKLLKTEGDVKKILNDFEKSREKDNGKAEEEDIDEPTLFA